MKCILDCTIPYHTIPYHTIPYHTITYTQEVKYKEASGFYESIVKKSYDNLLDVSPIVLANMCVSCIMTSQNDKV